MKISNWLNGLTTEHETLYDTEKVQDCGQPVVTATGCIEINDR
jgi:hypothetical protein